jgi:tetratricopeptide (TPR) repeat protein
MAVTSGLAITALQARDSARDQRREAEGLVAFMLGDLKDKLEPIGRLDALDGVGSRVLAYYSKQDAASLSDAALLQRSRALSLTAQVAYLRGDFGTALRLYDQARAGTEEAIRRDPDDPQRLFDNAQNVFWVGELSRLRGQIDRAEAAYREYKRLADKMVAIEPNNLKWRMEVAYANENLGIVLMSQRRFTEATRQFEAAIRPMQSVASIDARNAEYQKELSNLLGWLADARGAEGRLIEAISIRQRQIAFLEGLVRAGSRDVAFQQQLVAAHQGLGVLLTRRGQVEPGVQQYRLALERANGLIAVEPNNSYWKDLAASVRLELARNLLMLDRSDEAASEASIGCGITAALRARDPGVAKWRSLETTCLEMRSRVALQSGAKAQALAFAKQALASAQAQRSDDPIRDRYRVAAVYRLIGDLNRHMGDLEAARAAWSSGLAQLPEQVAAERPWEMSERAELLRRVGQLSDAQPLASRLAAIGYRSAS